MKKIIISFVKKVRLLIKDLPHTQQRNTATTQAGGGFFVERIQAQIKNAIYSFSPRQKKIFRSLLGIFLISIIGVLLQLNSFIKVEVPASGGVLREGVIGSPRFINPLLAISDADRDLTALVYSGLMRPTPSGDLVPDLAKEYEVSEDGITYTFYLKEGITWHDGEKITSEDIIFTITKVKDPILKSPKRASWEGVMVKAVNDNTIIFTLEQPYSPFLENTTLGILPAHIWDDVSSEQFGFSKFNTEPIGSGPYKIKKIKKDSKGIPKRYDLTQFKNFILGKAFIETLEINFYSNEEELLKAFEKGNISAINAIPPEKARELEEGGASINTYTLPRVFGIFFNQNQNPIFANHSVRSALNKAIDRDIIIDEILFGYGTAIYGPLPPGSLGFEAQLKKEEDDKDTGSLKEQAEEILEKGGWKLDKETGIRKRKTSKTTQFLKFSIVTSDTSELKNTANLAKEAWEAIGAKITLKIFNTSNLNQNVIRPRKYDSLLFGEIIGRESDPFAFWHSSQRNDPGLNIALYTNITADQLLEDGREISDIAERIKIYGAFEEEISNDIPAVFMYSPDFLYILPEKIKGVEAGIITTPGERFLDIHNWFIETENRYPFFVKK